MKNVRTSLRMLLILTLITGVIYPLFITLLAQITMHHQANGSFIYEGEKIVGTPLIAQKFTSDKYFWPRPSAMNYNPLPSGASNLGPTSAALKQIVQKRKEAAQKSHPGKGDERVPSDLLFASGSGLDPHISLRAVKYQLDRVLKARNLEQHRKKIEAIIEDLVEQRFCNLFGRPCVNVFLLNRALDSFLQDKGQ